MKISELLFEDYPGIQLSIISNINRMYAIIKEVTNKARYEAKDPNSNYQPWAEIARWSNNNYLAGRKMGVDGQSGLIQYMVRTAINKGASVNYDQVMLVAAPGKGDTAKQVFQKMIKFYTEYAPTLAPYIPEFTEDTALDIRQKAAMLSQVYSDFVGFADKQEKPTKAKRDDEYVDTKNNANLGQQTSQLDAVINGVIGDIAISHGKDVAHQIRQAVSRSGNKAVALKLELDRRGIKMNESHKIKIKQLITESLRK